MEALKHLPLGLVCCIAVLGLALGNERGLAQESSDTARLAAVATSVGRHLEILGRDSLRGRETPSVALERTARYLADEFARIGLRPRGDYEFNVSTDTSWFQRYPLPGQRTLDVKNSTLVFNVGLRRWEKDVVEDRGFRVSRELALPFDPALSLLRDTLPESGGTRGPSGAAFRMVQVASGRFTPARAREAAVQNAVIVFIPPQSMDEAMLRAVVAAFGERNAVLVVSAGVEMGQAKPATPPFIVDKYLERTQNVHHWAAAVDTVFVARALASAGIDVARLRIATTPSLRPAPSLAITWKGVLTALPAHVPSGVNVLATLPGRDSALRSQRVVVLAHADRFAAVGDDSAGHENSAGLAALLALAEAFHDSASRPRRSLIFAVVSGSSAGLWGSQYLTEHSSNPHEPTPRWLEFTSTSVSIDIRERPGDTLYVAGLDEVETRHPLSWVALQHAELGVPLGQGGTVFRADGDHFPFARKAIPSFAFHTGRHGATRLEAVRDEKATLARMTHLIFHAIAAVANDDLPPRWSERGRQARTLMPSR